MADLDADLDANRANKWMRRLLPLLILGLGAGGLVLMIKMRKPPGRKKRPKAAQLVEVVTVQAEKRRVEVTSNGVVQPRREASLAAEVSGRVRWLHRNLVVGGQIKKGAPLLVIDPVDYKLVVEKARSQVAQAERALAVAESSARVARTEWKQLGQGTGRAPTPLTLHEPQIKEARALLAAARADLEMAKLNLQRTTMRAPFNLRVRSEQVEAGQYVRVGQELTRVYGTDVAEVVVPLPVSELRWLEIPDGGSGRGSPVTVRLKTGAETHEREGWLVRSVGEVDPTGRMSKVVVAIEDPYNLEREADGQPAYEIGAFVEVALEGRMLDRVIPIPSEALRRGSRVWVAGAGDKLDVRRVTTARVDQNEALVLSGIEPGDRIVLSSITGAVDGMRLRVRPSQNGRFLRREASRRSTSGRVKQ
jgi:RND family efflux transporter MFP subunit